MDASNDLINWLMDGDPAIRWQTMRYLQGATTKLWKGEQRRTVSEGWGASLLALQASDGSWGGGIYSPKWTSTTYTLLTLCAIGIPSNYPSARRAAALVLDKQLGRIRDDGFMRNLAACDRCIVGMILQIAAYFGIRDARTDAMVENLLGEMMPDGAWNCRRLRKPKPHHSSFHTTFNVLEGLREWLKTATGHPLRNNVLNAEQSALEFTLQHRLFKSDRSGEVIDKKFTLLSYPHRWHYNVLRGLVYFAEVNAPCDERFQDAIKLLNSRRRVDGTWPVQHKYSGKVFFEMEKVGGPSRWNTLRALRVLQWASSTVSSRRPRSRVHAAKDK
jgi:hypothetical protein